MEFKEVSTRSNLELLKELVDYMELNNINMFKSITPTEVRISGITFVIIHYDYTFSELTTIKEIRR